MSIVRSHVLISIDANTLLAGAKAVEEALINELRRRGIDKEVGVIETGPLGIIGKGVVMVVYPEGVYYGNVKPEDIPELVEEHFIKGRPLKRLMIENITTPSVVVKEEVGLTKRQVRIVLKNSGVINPESIEEYIASDGFDGLTKAIFEMKPEDVIKVVKDSGLRGRGGAGFPTGLKWEFTYKIPSDEKYVICNADEGEPGTFKDRLILEGDPYRIVEAMTIAGYAVGAKKGYIYIRGEYKLSIDRMHKAIQTAKEYGLLGDNILGSNFSFDIEVRKGAGAYICGEETALIESLEGKRGVPRIKPPYPVSQGLRNKPTVVNNVETLANIPDIVRNGAEWFRQFGTEKCPGTKVYTILGDVINAGLIEVEMGTPLREIIFQYGGGIKDGKKFKCALVGGAAGAFLGEEMLDVKMDFENLKEYKAVLGSGAILVMNESACIVDMLKSILRFFEHESCGRCTPCRVGTKRLVEIINRFANLEGSEEDIDEMVNISLVMKDTSFCPLGQSVHLPVVSAIRYFKDEFINHFKEKYCVANRCGRKVKVLS
jgi:NADH:ubiquinone oxidoreductase subunit F (NADH-binding)/(2Fe-2S) ferredoxin|uniref:NADH-quinone oxidoreductase subunit NuoF n=1 Tax=Dictyoglomus turgidum TaxID=513050 RepID=A0A7C3WY55_9BACT